MSDDLLCRQSDVKVALNASINKFCEGGYTKIGDLMTIIEEEFSKIPLLDRSSELLLWKSSKKK
jgi:hypothetical protein